MTTIRLGNDYLAWIGVGAAAVLIKGQKTGSLKQTMASFDASSKDSGGFALEGAGLVKVQFDLTINANAWPDATGYGALQTAFNTYPRVPVDIQIRSGGTAGTFATNLVFDAQFWILDLSPNFAQDAVLSVTAQFSLAGVPATLLTLA